MILVSDRFINGTLELWDSDIKTKIIIPIPDMQIKLPGYRYICALIDLQAICL